MPTKKISEAARLLTLCHANGGLLRSLPQELSPATTDEAYQIQDTSVLRRNDQVAGWKIGLSSAAALEKLQLDEPIVGSVLASTVYGENETCEPTTVNKPILEAEFAYRFSVDVGPGDHPADIEKMVDSAFVSLEIADSRFTQKCSIADIIADNSNASAFIVGPDVETWRNVPLSQMPVKLTVNGSTVDPLEGKERCDPDAILRWFLTRISERGLLIRKGQFVTTGAAALVQLETDLDHEITVRVGDVAAMSAVVSIKSRSPMFPN